MKKYSATTIFTLTIILLFAFTGHAATIPDISGAFTSSGFNLVGNRGTVTGFNQSTDQVGSSSFADNFNSDSKDFAPSVIFDPLLAPLANNGGTVPTHALINGSRAVDKGNSFGSTTDVRGLLRPVDSPSIANATGGDGADIGAFEAQSPTSAAVSISGRVSAPDGRGIVNARVILTDSQGNSRTVLTSAFGYFRFDEVAAGETYVVSVASKRFQFAPQVVNVVEDLSDFNLTAFQ